MATPRTPNQKKQYAKLNARLAKYGKLIERIYDKYNREAAQIAIRTDFDPDSDKMFHFKDYPQTRDAIGKLFDGYIEDISGTINTTTSEEWLQSNEVQDLLANKVLKAYGVRAKDGKEYQRYYQVNSDHLKAFQTRTVNGMNLSRRVWNLKEQYKQELEMGLSVGIEKGTSAASLAKQLKQYLNEPDKLFRRVRDKYGNLELSKNAKAYHPGRGIYRSSYKNALRLTRSEANMAYRTAEQTRWKQFDFVVGYEIKLSQSHPCHDVCDDLAGKYPKDFVWTGWHPQDLCYCVSILKTDDEFWRDLGNEEATGESENQVTDVPEAFKDWVRDNAERIETAEKCGTQPYFVRDNKEYIDEALKPAERESNANNSSSSQEIKKTPLEIAAERHAARTQEDIDDLKRRFWMRYEPNNLTLEQKNANIDAYLQIERDLGIKRGIPMNHNDANMLRGNPNYAVSENYRTNCQTCVVAYELRRRGFDIEALGNTKDSWLEKLSRHSNEIWSVIGGEIPQKTRIGATFTKLYEKDGKNYGYWEKTAANRKQLVKALEESIAEDGRYHIDWIWKSQSKNVKGHIVTLEKIGSKFRYYDPQNGEVIDNFYNYISDIQLKRGINYLRVDNKIVHANYASHILGKSLGNVVNGETGNGKIIGKIKSEKLKQVREDNKKWVDTHLPMVALPDGNYAYRDIVTNINKSPIVINQGSFGEIIAKNKRNKELNTIVDISQDYKEWMPKAILTKEKEPGIHHNFPFNVYEVEYKGRKLEIKTKLTDAEYLYNIRFIK